MRLDLMVEGQEDVSWESWLEIAGACERAGIGTLFRSDHYFSVDEIDARGSLDAWGTICGLAAATETLCFGTLVSPVTFRHPSTLAKLVVTAQAVAGGDRIELGLGAGWWKAEHESYGFALPPTWKRMRILAEQAELISRQWTEESVSFSGKHYETKQLTAWPLPERKPRLIMGGQAGPKSARLAARWADEYNTPHANLEQCRERREAITAACEQAGREPIPLSAMLGFVIARDRDSLLEKAAEHARWRNSDAGSPQAYLDSLPDHYVIGTVEEAAAQLRELERAGVSRAMLQHHVYWDTETIELIGHELADAVG
ncbi:MAG: LLM class flavin-dependent oxidoreductase [Solirubrobacterales bacterium]|nr:LLM class flavin-dependent oxidoreductase [Solirubrobacterales bacterium]